MTETQSRESAPGFSDFTPPRRFDMDSEWGRRSMPVSYTHLTLPTKA